MATIQWQCLNCGMQKNSSNMPSLTNQCIKDEDRHDWRDMGKAINDGDYWRCIYCGGSALKMNPSTGYPNMTICLERKTLKCIWVRFTSVSDDYKKWKCQKCSRNPPSFDKLLKQKGIPGPGQLCPGNCVNGTEYRHVWQYIK